MTKYISGKIIIQVVVVLQYIVTFLVTFETQ